jgi:2-oxoglutarate ferredoxin oxidoreductase subunit beta
MPCLLFYVLRFVNTSGENVTVLNERARRRAAGRAEWFSQVGKPLQREDIPHFYNRLIPRQGLETTCVEEVRRYDVSEYWKELV